MTTSCGNPSHEADSLMIRRQRFDKSHLCVRCKQKRGNTVIRHTVYCKSCFFSLVSVKFRRALEPSVNPVPDGPRRKATKAGGNLLLGLSGGLGSTVLLELVHQTYFSQQIAPVDAETGKPKGGEQHPRNARVWSHGVVCYVETCSAFPGLKDSTEEIHALVAKYDALEFIPLRLEDAFDPTWWSKMRGIPLEKDLTISLAAEDLFVSDSSNLKHADNPITRLQAYISSLPTQTAIPSAIQTLIRVLLLYTASATGSSHLLLGTSMTSLSISLISSISQGGGFVITEEAQEEWMPKLSTKPNGHENGAIRVVRPIQDIGMKECAIWAWWSGLHVVGGSEFTALKQSIGPLTKNFIIGLERDYPSTVSTIARTCAKLTPKKSGGGICSLCERPRQSGIQEWKAQISIRSFKPMSSNMIPLVEPGPASLTPFLCYMCHTTLTSKSSRGTTISAPRSAVPLPVWATSDLDATFILQEPLTAEADDRGTRELWRRTKMDSEQMKVHMADFLLEEA